MTLIVEIEDFLKTTRCQVVETTQRDAIVMICVPGDQVTTEPSVTAPDLDDDDLITWEDAAWQ